MKTRIFISSKTNLNYIRYDSSIEVLNDIISFYSYEEYDDFIDMNDNDFYIRCKNDSLAKPTFKCMSYDDLVKRIDKAIIDKVDKVVFIINENEKELIELIEKIIDEDRYPDISLIKTKLLLYPFDYALLEANKSFKKDGNIDELTKKFKEVEDKFKLYIFTPEHDILPTISKIDYDEDILEVKKGVLYECNKDGVVLLKKYKNKYPFDYLVKSITTEIAGVDVISFILYTDAYSKYIEVLEKQINALKVGDKIIKEVLPAYYGNMYGINSLIVGFIVKE